MNLYEELIQESFQLGLIVYEREFRSGARGLIDGNLIGIRRSLTSREKSGILAEEIGHHYTGVGRSLSRSLNSRRQEVRARQWGHIRIIPFSRFLDAHRARISGRYDLAAYLDVAEVFLQEAVDRYKDKHGLFVELDDEHTLCLDPLFVIEPYAHAYKEVVCSAKLE
ncbi:ImmA/IrrE family metallo-endopeptidase [Saccharibacillus sacchari]|uniref:ImmA/IrrE family metallo-endopeptidase n=1 Tax=Saccharibacillus sacchari TaxID=456493 RepID=A0ACC6PI25_9BACL